MACQRVIDWPDGVVDIDPSVARTRVQLNYLTASQYEAPRLSKAHCACRRHSCTLQLLAVFAQQQEQEVA